jgi:hypothetical protein
MPPELAPALVENGAVQPTFLAHLLAWLFDGEDDHVHLLVNYPPKVSVSNLVNS